MIWTNVIKRVVFFSVSTSERGRPGHAALEGNHMTCLALLLCRGADLEAKNRNQQTLLQCITRKYGQTGTYKLLEESGNKCEMSFSQFPPIFCHPSNFCCPLEASDPASLLLHRQCMPVIVSWVSKIKFEFALIYTTTARGWLEKNSNQKCQLHIIAWIFDWFPGLLLSFVIGQSGYFGFGILN